MSYKFGDDTAYMLGRVTLNPIKHTDPIGTLLIPIVGFIAAANRRRALPLIGWGIPTPVNPRKWTNYKLANVHGLDRGHRCEHHSGNDRLHRF
jgi:Zn-dependent protease